ARADGIQLRLLYLFASAGKAYSDRQYWKPPIPDRRGRSGIRLVADAQMKRDGGVGRNHYPKTDIVVTVRGMIVDVTIHGPGVVLIVDPRAAPQVRRSEPHSLRCAQHHTLMIQKIKKFWSACGAGGCATRFSPPIRVQEEKGDATTTRKPTLSLRSAG